MIGRCPRCGTGRLFKGVLKLAPKCEACGLELQRLDQGDGPAAFAIFFVGVIVIGGALLLDSALHPPWWVHAVIWIPVTFGVTIVCLRIIKSWLVKQQYLHLPPELPPERPAT